MTTTSVVHNGGAALIRINVPAQYTCQSNWIVKIYVEYISRAYRFTPSFRYSAVLSSSLQWLCTTISLLLSFHFFVSPLGTAFSPCQPTFCTDSTWRIIWITQCQFQSVGLNDFYCSYWQRHMYSQSKKEKTTHTHTCNRNILAHVSIGKCIRRPGRIELNILFTTYICFIIFPSIFVTLYLDIVYVTNMFSIQFSLRSFYLIILRLLICVFSSRSIWLVIRIITWLFENFSRVAPLFPHFDQSFSLRSGFSFSLRFLFFMLISVLIQTHRAH